MQTENEQVLLKLLEGVFGESNAFLMGSRYFGLNIEKADFDFLIYLDPSKLENDTPYKFDELEESSLAYAVSKFMQERLWFLSLEFVDASSYAKLSSISFKGGSYHYRLGFSIDLIVILDWNYFSSVIEEHKEVKNYIERNNLVDLLIKLKKHISGKDLYRSIRDVSCSIVKL